MKFSNDLKEGKFLRRYKRFFADIIDSDGNIVAHVPNTGSLKGCLEEGAPCRYTFVDDPKRKLKYTLQMIKTRNSWVGVNTGLSNQMAWELWETKQYKFWNDFDGARREIKLNDKSRIDLVLWKSCETYPPGCKLGPADFSQHIFHFVEVKNVTLAEKGVAMFPDAVTTRGQKHLCELMQLLEQGHSCELLFTVQRTDCKSFSPARDIDPEYARLLQEAVQKGLRVTALPCDFDQQGLQLNPNKALLVQI